MTGLLTDQIIQTGKDKQLDASDNAQAWFSILKTLINWIFQIIFSRENYWYRNSKIFRKVTRIAWLSQQLKSQLHQLKKLVRPIQIRASNVLKERYS